MRDFERPEPGSYQSAGGDAVYDSIVEAKQSAGMHPEAEFTGGERRRARLIVRDVGTYHRKQVVRKHFEDSLVLDNISFRYRDDAAYIFEDMNLTVKKGQIVVIIGASGAGKSTLVDILLGLLVPQQGRVAVDGASITGMPDEWTEMVGYVPQSVFLLSGSIREKDSGLR